jgi:site-specific recombinase XerD
VFSNVNKFREETDAKRIIQIREITRELPQSCSDFIRSIAVTTSTLTRLAYAIDLRTFFQFLQSERVAFSDMKLSLMTDQDLEKLTRNDLTAYTEYLTFYYKNESSVPNKAYVNHELSIKRKLCSIRSFYDYLFKNQRISSNITELVPLPKIHEKPIIRLSLDEMERILELAVIYACVPRKQHERDTVPHMERQRFSNTLGLTINGMRR